MENYFTYKSRYDEYQNCYFRTGRYPNGNLAIGIYNANQGPITKVTINPDITLPDDIIAIKNYSENSGIVEWLVSEGIVEELAESRVDYRWVSIPLHKLTEKGKQMLGI